MSHVEFVKKLILLGSLSCSLSLVSMTASAADQTGNTLVNSSNVGSAGNSISSQQWGSFTRSLANSNTGLTSLFSPLQSQLSSTDLSHISQSLQLSSCAAGAVALCNGLQNNAKNVVSAYQAVQSLKNFSSAQLAVLVNWIAEQAPTNLAVATMINDFVGAVQSLEQQESPSSAIATMMSAFSANENSADLGALLQQMPARVEDVQNLLKQYPNLTAAQQATLQNFLIEPQVNNDTSATINGIEQALNAVAAIPAQYATQKAQLQQAIFTMLQTQANSSNLPSDLTNFAQLLSNSGSRASTINTSMSSINGAALSTPYLNGNYYSSFLGTPDSGAVTDNYAWSASTFYQFVGNYLGWMESNAYNSPYLINGQGWNLNQAAVQYGFNAGYTDGASNSYDAGAEISFFALLYYKQFQNLAYDVSTTENGKTITKPQTWDGLMANLLTLVANNPLQINNIQSLFALPNSLLANTLFSIQYNKLPQNYVTSTVTPEDNNYYDEFGFNVDQANVVNPNINKFTEVQQQQMQQAVISLIENNVASSNLTNLINGYNQAVDMMVQTNTPGNILQQEINWLLQYPQYANNLVPVFQNLPNLISSLGSSGPISQIQSQVIAIISSNITNDNLGSIMTSLQGIVSEYIQNENNTIISNSMQQILNNLMSDPSKVTAVQLNGFAALMNSSNISTYASFIEAINGQGAYPISLTQAQLTSLQQYIEENLSDANLSQSLESFTNALSILNTENNTYESSDDPFATSPSGFQQGLLSGGARSGMYIPPLPSIPQAYPQLWQSLMTLLVNNVSAASNIATAFGTLVNIASYVDNSQNNFGGNNSNAVSQQLINAGVNLLQQFPNNPDLPTMLSNYNQAIQNMNTLYYSQAPQFSNANDQLTAYTNTQWQTMLGQILNLIAQNPQQALAISQAAQALPAALNQAASMLQTLVQKDYVTGAVAVTIPSIIFNFLLKNPTTSDPAQILSNLTAAMKNLQVFAKTASALAAEGIEYTTWENQVGSLMQLMINNPADAQNIETATATLPGLYQTFSDEVSDETNYPLSDLVAAVNELIQQGDAGNIATQINNLQAAIQTFKNFRDNPPNFAGLPIAAGVLSSTFFAGVTPAPTFSNGMQAWQGILNSVWPLILANPQNASNLMNAVTQMSTVLSTSTLEGEGYSADQIKQLQAHYLDYIVANPTSTTISQALATMQSALQSLSTANLKGTGLSQQQVINAIAANPENSADIYSALAQMQTITATINSLAAKVGISTAQQQALLQAAQTLFTNQAGNSALNTQLDNFNSALQTLISQSQSSAAIAVQRIGSGNYWLQIVSGILTGLSNNPSNSAGITAAFNQMLSTLSSLYQSASSDSQGIFQPADLSDILVDTLQNNMNNPNIVNVFQNMMANIQLLNNALAANPVLTDENAQSLWSFMTVNRQGISIPRFMQTFTQALDASNTLASMTQKDQLNSALFGFFTINKNSPDINGLMEDFQELMSVMAAQPGNKTLWQAFNAIAPSLEHGTISITQMDAITQIFTQQANNPNLLNVMNSVANLGLNQATATQLQVINHILTVNPKPISENSALMDVFQAESVFSYQSLLEQIVALSAISNANSHSAAAVSTINANIGNFITNYLPYMFPASTVASISEYLKNPANVQQAPTVMRALIMSYMTNLSYPNVSSQNSSSVLAMQELNGMFEALSASGYQMNYGSLQSVYNILNLPGLNIPASYNANFKSMLYLAGVNAEQPNNPNWTPAQDVSACMKESHINSCTLSFSANLPLTQPFTTLQLHTMQAIVMYNTEPKQLYEQVIKMDQFSPQVQAVIRWAIDDNEIKPTQVPILINALNYYEQLHQAEQSGNETAVNTLLQEDGQNVANYQGFLSVLGARYEAAQQGTTLEAEDANAGNGNFFNNDIYANNPFSFISIQRSGDARMLYDKSLEDFDMDYFVDSGVYAKAYLTASQQSYLNANLESFAESELVPMFECPTGDAGINCQIKRGFDGIFNGIANTFKGDSVGDIFRDIGLSAALLVSAPMLLPLAPALVPAFAASMAALETLDGILANYSQLKDTSEALNDVMGLALPPEIGLLRAYVAGCQTSTGINCLKNFGQALTEGMAKSLVAPFDLNNNLSLTQRLIGGINSVINIYMLGEGLHTGFEKLSGKTMAVDDLTAAVDEQLGKLDANFNPDEPLAPQLNSVFNGMLRISDKDYARLSEPQLTSAINKITAFKEVLKNDPNADALNQSFDQVLHKLQNAKVKIMQQAPTSITETTFPAKKLNTDKVETRSNDARESLDESLDGENPPLSGARF